MRSVAAKNVDFCGYNEKNFCQERERPEIRGGAWVLSVEVLWRRLLNHGCGCRASLDVLFRVPSLFLVRHLVCRAAFYLYQGQNLA